MVWRKNGENFMGKSAKTSLKIPNFYVEHPTTALNMMLNLSCHSANLEHLNIATRKGYRKERSQINIFVQAPFGEFKSTIFNFVSQHYPSIVLTDISFPKLVGSFDVKSRTVIPSASWEYRNKTIILDEFYFRKGILNALLGLMEGGEYSRAMARNLLKTTNRKDGDLYFKCSKSGWIKVKTRCNWIIGTMHNVANVPRVTYDALISRCIPIYYKLFPDQFKEILEGKRKLFTPLDFGEPLMQIEWDDVEYVWSVINDSDLVRYSYKHNLIARTLGDCLRCYNIIGKHNIDLYEFIISMKSYLPDVRWINQQLKTNQKQKKLEQKLRKEVFNEITV